MFSIIEKHYTHNKNMYVKRSKYRVGDDAEDAVQEAYTRACQYAYTFEMGMNFNTWFSKILSNVIKDFIRARFDGIETVELETESNEYAEDTSKYDDEIDALRHRIQNVKKESHREILSLYFIYGLPLSHINQIVEDKYKNIDQIIYKFKKGILEV